MPFSTEKECACTDEVCIKNDSICDKKNTKNQYLRIPFLKTDFRQRVYLLHQDILTTVFEFEEDSSRKINYNEKKLNEMRTNIDIKKSSVNKYEMTRYRPEPDPRLSEFHELDRRHELEKAIIIRESDKKLQTVVHVFNSNLAEIERSLQQRWKDAKKHSEDTSMKFKSALTRFKAMAESIIVEKSKEINRLKEIINRYNLRRDNHHVNYNKKYLEKYYEKDSEKDFVNKDLEIDVKKDPRNISKVKKTRKLRIILTLS